MARVSEDRGRCSLNTIYAIQPAFPWWFPRVVRTLHDEIIWNGNLQGVFEDRDKAIRVYKEWIEEVKRTVPARKLLVYNVKEGWGPLCGFLGVPVPAGKMFPHINERKSFRRLILLLKILNWLVPLAILVSLALLIVCCFLEK